MIFTPDGQPNLSPAAVDWFRRRLLATIRDWQANGDPGVRKLLGDPRVVELVVDGYAARIQDFIRWEEGDSFRLDGDEDYGRIHYNQKAVRDAFWQMAGPVEDAVLQADEAAKYPTLDAWFAAVLADEHEWSGPTEPAGDELVPKQHREAFQRAVTERRAHWPRVCKVCGREYQRTRHNQRRCTDCVAAGRSRPSDPPRPGRAGPSASAAPEEVKRDALAALDKALQAVRAAEATLKHRPDGGGA